MEKKKGCEADKSSLFLCNLGLNAYTQGMEDLKSLVSSAWDNLNTWFIQEPHF